MSDALQKAREEAEAILSQPEEKETVEAAKEEAKGEAAESASTQEAAKKDSQVLVINHKGKEVALPVEKVLELASAGFDYNIRNRELAEARAALETDKAGLDGYKNLQRWLEEHPVAGASVQQILDHVEKTGKLPVIDFSKEGGEARSGDPVTNKRIQALEDQLAASRRANEERNFAASIADAVLGNPTLKWASENTRKTLGDDLVTKKLADLALANPGVEIDVLAASLATEIETKSETLRSRTRQDEDVAKRKAETAARFDTVPSNVAARVPGATKEPERRYSLADMQSGRIIQDGMKILAESQG